MNARTQQLYNSALQFSDRERAEVAAWLIESLDHEVDDNVEAVWDAEISGRIAELDSGAVTAVPWPEARQRILGLSDGPATD
jgi:putative addiction module component (TIGR02574 family)